MRSRARAVLVVLAVLTAAAAALRLCVGPEGLFDLPRDGVEWRLRLARAASGATVGAALGAAGVFLQAMLRNPLASPSVLGMTSGAALGVVGSIYAGYLATGAIVRYEPPAAAALAGALGSLVVVYAVAQKRGLLEPISLILVGVVVSIMCGAATMFLQHLLPDAGVATSARWMLGAISDDVSPARRGLIAGATVAGVGVGAWMGPAMDAASLSDDEAQSVGVRLGTLRAVLFTLAGVLTAGTVLLAGPIGFVGLICPHAVRLLAGPAHRALVIGSAMAGASLILLADALVRAVSLEGGRLPIGVLTALVGGPAFLILLRRGRLSP